MGMDGRVVQAWGSVRAFRRERERRLARAQASDPSPRGAGELLAFPSRSLSPEEKLRECKQLVADYYAMPEADRRWLAAEARRRAAVLAATADQ